MAGVANGAGEWKIFKSTIFSGEAGWAMMLPRIWSLSARLVIKKPTGKPKTSKIHNVRVSTSCEAFPAALKEVRVGP
jgi:hypothetical protein